MKKKGLTYILVVSTLLLWGGIVYRIVSYTNGDKILQPMEEKMTEEVKRDTFDYNLKLNYRDPFFESDKKNNIEKQVKSDHRIAVPVSEPPTFKFKGIIRNRKRIYMVIESNGSIETLSRESPIEGYKIITLHTDSVILEKKGQKYILKIDL